jgi:hypothetical protein
MSFSTKSYLAGVGSVIAALTIGFSGGFLIAKPTPYTEQNRLQRVTSSAPIASSAPQIASPAPQTAAALPTPAITEARIISTETKPPAVQSAPPETTPIIAKAAAPEPAPVVAKSEPAPAVAKSEPVRTAVEQTREPDSNGNAEKRRAVDAKAAESSDAKIAERKRIEARKLAERRKQREIELATLAVKRMLRDRGNPQQVADGIETPRFGFFGQD